VTGYLRRAPGPRYPLPLTARLPASLQCGLLAMVLRADPAARRIPAVVVPAVAVLLNAGPWRARNASRARGTGCCLHANFGQRGSRQGRKLRSRRTRAARPRTRVTSRRPPSSCTVPPVPATFQALCTGGTEISPEKWGVPSNPGVPGHSYSSRPRSGPVYGKCLERLERLER
jgi:hypothetical protein